MRQDLAITGSLNQHGKVQPVGGITHKIEGFYHTCKLKGITGTQGVVIPHQNITNLMLRSDVVTAVKEGNFHIYTAETIDDIIEIMTECERKVSQKGKASLKDMAETAQKFYDGENNIKRGLSL